ncbi:hypothetical protein TSOC_013056 [Tetrabaena socialis]|uniref:TNase-like domain-containing protein n=1 Tax=Tetrabaena socialis TaxID=47790 RepID=A0A2J7ZLD8_9CHLO|nr:hypothetical protein TSOC_013056 [Tetrabaena socialis]|eukprot:PNH01081.1 hypothetical protein TSOC_013056 [Tetrabaena socialis]
MDPSAWTAWTTSTTPQFSVADLRCWARLLDVHDGDTIAVAAEVLPGHTYQLRIRLAGIDAPEMSRVNVLAEDARRRLVGLLAPTVQVNTTAHMTRGEMQRALQADVNLVFIKCMQMDKYGRVLAHVARGPDEEHVQDILLREGHARAYDGGTR